MMASWRVRSSIRQEDVTCSRDYLNVPGDVSDCGVEIQASAVWGSTGKRSFRTHCGWVPHVNRRGGLFDCRIWLRRSRGCREGGHWSLSLLRASSQSRPHSCLLVINLIASPEQSSSVSSLHHRRSHEKHHRPWVVNHKLLCTHIALPLSTIGTNTPQYVNSHQRADTSISVFCLPCNRLSALPSDFAF